MEKAYALLQNMFYSLTLLSHYSSGWFDKYYDKNLGMSFIEPLFRKSMEKENQEELLPRKSPTRYLGPRQKDPYLHEIGDS